MEKRNYEIEINDDGPAPLYHIYPLQHNPQPAFIDYDPRTCRLTADWSGEIGGGVPMNVFNGLVLRFSVRPDVSRRALEQFVDEEVTKLLDRIWDGYDYDYQKGSLTEDAEDAVERVRDIIDEMETVEVWAAEGWLLNDDTDLDDIIRAGGIRGYAELCNCPDAGQVIFGGVEAIAKELAENVIAKIESNYGIDWESDEDTPDEIRELGKSALEF